MTKIMVIKRIETQRFALTLGQAGSGMYYIKFSNHKDAKSNYISESIKDLSIALSIFDTKLAEIEGH